jgi:hypothetical protein
VVSTLNPSFDPLVQTKDFEEYFTVTISLHMASMNLKIYNNHVHLFTLILQSFDWLAAFHLELLQAIPFIAV